MKLPLFPLSLALVLVGFISGEAQKRRPVETERRSGSVSKAREPRSLMVVDETLSVLRSRPSLFADPIQRLRRGRIVNVSAAAEADGVRFYKVTAPTGYAGWVQADALFGRARAGDEERFARLVEASDGFDQIELASAFLQMFPASHFRAPMLLLLGDLVEGTATKLSRDAKSRLSAREMAASGAPIHSFYLNFNMLDRYRRLGVKFLFNPSTRTFHYDGASWREIVRKFPASAEAAEAQKRLDSLRTKLERG
jgi:hypothetical protein